LHRYRDIIELRRRRRGGQGKGREAAGAGGGGGGRRRGREAAGAGGGGGGTGMRGEYMQSARPVKRAELGVVSGGSYVRCASGARGLAAGDTRGEEQELPLAPQV